MTLTLVDPFEKAFPSRPRIALPRRRGVSALPSAPPAIPPRPGFIAGPGGTERTGNIARRAQAISQRISDASASRGPGYLNPRQDRVNGASFFQQEASRTKTMRALSVPDQPLSSLARFARAARGRDTEISATIHPLSGRVMQLERGTKNNVPIRSPEPSRAREKALALARRSSNPEVADRAFRLAREGTGSGPRPIYAHSHPPSTGRQMPSGTDLTSGNMQRFMPDGRQRRGQNVVVTPRREGARRGGKNTSAVWSGFRPDARPIVTPRQATRLAARDFSTQDKENLAQIGASPVNQRVAAAARSMRRVGVVTGRVPSMDYDSALARVTRGAKTRNPDEPFYTRQTYLKRDKDRPTTGLQVAGAGGIGLAAGANRIAEQANSAKLRANTAQLLRAEQRKLNLKQVRREDAVRTGRRTASPAQEPVRERAGRTKGAARRADPRNQTTRRALKTMQTEIRDIRTAGNIPAIGRRGVERMTAGGLAFGIPALAIGTRNRYEPAKTTASKSATKTREDVDREIAGALAGAGAHQGVVYGSKPIDRRLAAQIARDPKLKTEWEAHRAKHGNPAVGSSRNKAMFRDYPRSLPGARFKRVMAHVGAGKTGLATTAASAGGGALLADELTKAYAPSARLPGAPMSRDLVTYRRARATAALRRSDYMNRRLDAIQMRSGVPIPRDEPRWQGYATATRRAHGKTPALPTYANGVHERVGKAVATGRRDRSL